MSEQPPISRRRLLLGAAAVAAAALVPSGARRLGLAGSTSSSVVVLASRLRALLDDPAAAARLGRDYLDWVTRWPTVEELIEQLLPMSGTIESTSQSDPGVLLRGIAERRASDYREGRIVPCDGWLISETEGRLAALHIVS